MAEYIIIGTESSKAIEDIVRASMIDNGMQERARYCFTKDENEYWDRLIVYCSRNKRIWVDLYVQDSEPIRRRIGMQDKFVMGNFEVDLSRGDFRSSARLNKADLGRLDKLFDLLRPKLPQDAHVFKVHDAERTDIRAVEWVYS